MARVFLQIEEQARCFFGISFQAEVFEVFLFLFLGRAGRGVEVDPIALAGGVFVYSGVWDSGGAEWLLIHLAGEDRE